MERANSEVAVCHTGFRLNRLAARVIVSDTFALQLSSDDEERL